MARTISEIKAEMIKAKESNPNLSGLTSTSATAIWSLIFYVAAASIAIFESLFDLFKSDITTRSKEIPTGTLQWYASESLKYQQGDALQLIDGTIDYPNIDADKQIIKLASANEANGLVVIKVASLNGSGDAIPLTTAERQGFEAYWISKRFAGTAISVISQEADLLKAYYRIKVNQSIINPQNGESTTESNVFPIEAAINNFLKTFQGENFAGDMQVMRLTDAIQSVDGVVNVVANQIEAKPYTGNYTDVLSNVDQTYTSAAGHIKIDPSFPLSSTINYTV